MISYVLEDYG